MNILTRIYYYSNYIITYSFYLYFFIYIIRRFFKKECYIQLPFDFITWFISFITWLLEDGGEWIHWRSGE